MGNFEINFDRPEPSGGVVEIRGGGPGRGVVAIAVCLVIVVVLVVAYGRSRDKSVADLPTTTLVLPTTTAVGASTTTTAASTTSSAATTTTTLAAVQVYGPLLPEKTDASLFVARIDGRLVQVDVDSGTVTDLAPGQRFPTVYQLLVLQNGVLVGGDRALFVAGGEVTSLQFAVDQVLGSPDGIQVIGVSYSETSAEVVSFIPGGSRGPTIKLPLQSDAISLVPGAIVLQARAGGVYRFDLADGGTRKIADGTLVAIAGDRVASMTCDDTLQCSIGLGALGKRPQHQVAVPDPFVWYYGQGGNALSPTRDLMAYQTNVEGRLTFAVLDLDTGSVVLSVSVTSGRQGFAPLMWSPDGRWLFWVDSGHVKAWSPDRGGSPLEFVHPEAGAAEMIAGGYSA